MRDVFREYRDGKITWDEAYAAANNLAATAALEPDTEQEQVNWYASQMDSLANDAAEKLMELLGYKEDNSGVYFKP